MNKMRILHTEASQGWGGQEIRILKEAKGMRKKGHEVFFAVHPKAILAEKALKEGFEVYFIPFKMSRFIPVAYKLIRLILKKRIDLINTHSSIDAWIGGAAARLTRRKVIRTRHLSASIKKGLNSLVLYNLLADGVATTCKEVEQKIRSQAHLPPHRCLSIPTGIEPKSMNLQPELVADFRASLGINPDDCVVGTLCVLRSWKGISDFLKTAAALKNDSAIKWLIIGSGPGDDYYRKEAAALGLEESVIFAGHLDPPFTALAAVDIFVLLSTANEGVSQASLQAAYLKKPLITTATGGLKEVTLSGKTGFIVPINAPDQVAEKIKLLANDPSLRKQLGDNASELVLNQFTLEDTVESMEALYKKVLCCKISHGASEIIEKM